MANKKGKLTQVGIIGAGSFGTTLAKLCSVNVDVLIYSRHSEEVAAINDTHRHFGQILGENVVATGDLERVAQECTVIFPVVPSSSFRSVMKDISPFLDPSHLIIHGTKGLDLDGVSFDEIDKNVKLDRRQVLTMSEIILAETVVLRVGCLSGPNLASEILAGQPTATVVASEFDEVIHVGKEVLASNNFYVFGSNDLKGAEIAGALKNIFALGSGILEGMGLGRNAQAMLITRGLSEMAVFGLAMGTSAKAFLGTAGLGDLIATATSKNSRNFSFGSLLGKGESFENAMLNSTEVVEGVRTLKIIYYLTKSYKIPAPVTHAIFRIVYEQQDSRKVIKNLMNFPFAQDVEFI